MLTTSHTSYSLDDRGFLEHPELWDEEFAEAIASQIGIASGLSAEHWRVIRYLRRKLEEEQVVPYFVTACIELGLRITDFRALFPTGFMRGACRAAGLSYAVIAEKNPLQTCENLPDLWQGYRLSATGFLEDFESWDERFANLVAASWDLPCGLTEAHFRVIRFLRERYAATRSIPVVYETCQANHLSLAELHALFPTGYRRGACRIAGLPFE